MPDDLIERLLDPDWRGPMQHCRAWSDLDAIMDEAAAALAEQKAEIERLRTRDEETLSSLDAMGSVHDWGVHSASIPVGVEMTSSRGEAVEEGKVSVVRVRPPALTKPLTEDEAARLAFVASFSRRGFEVVYDHGKTSFLLSSSPGDMDRYRMALESVYGRLDCEPVAMLPPGLSGVEGL